jgi:hypothetical protein
MAKINARSTCVHRFNRCALFLSILILLLAAVSYSQQMATVTRPNATLHGTPMAVGKVITSLQKGTRVEILIAQGTWHLVQSQDYVGWISNGAIQPDDTQDAVIPTATPVTLKSTTLPPPSTTPLPGRPASSRTYIRGARGGCYYINSNGNKTYVDRSLCN